MRPKLAMDRGLELPSLGADAPAGIWVSETSDELSKLFGNEDADSDSSLEIILFILQAKDPLV